MLPCGAIGLYFLYHLVEIIKCTTATLVEHIYVH